MAVPTITNNSPSAGYIAWGAFTIQLKGVAYSVAAASSNQRWVWWEYKNGAPIINAGPDVPLTLNDDDLVLFGNKNGIGVRVQSSNFIDGELLVDGSIFAEAIATNQIQTQHMGAGTINGDRISAGTIMSNQVVVGGGDNTLLADWLQLQAEAYAQSRGTDLVTNGTGFTKDNTNFSQYEYVATDAPTGITGSFRAPTPGSTSKVTDEYIPIDPAKSFQYAFWARQRSATAGGNLYGTIAPYDAAKNTIAPSHYMYQANTLTTLAAPLNPGDTKVTLTSSANWKVTGAGAAVHLRSIIFWDYVDSFGKAWPELTYSRNFYTNLYDDGGIAGNVITLRVPWAGPAKPAGTKLSNGSSGSTYLYSPSNVSVPQEWTHYAGVVSGVNLTGTSSVFENGFPPGTAFIRVGHLMNRDVATSDHAVAGVSFSDAGASAAAAAEAQAQADAAYLRWAPNGVTTIDGGKITADSIAAAQIAANAITASELAANAVTAAKILARTITAAQIAADTVTANEIATNAITANELAVGAVTANHLKSGTILADSISSVGLNADWIRAGVINAARVSLGSSTVSILQNANMEDPYVDPVGVFDWQKFAGWEASIYKDGAGSAISQASVPISGSRSIQLVLPTSADGQRVISSLKYPVVPGQVWTLSAKFRINKNIDKADVITTLGDGSTLLGLMFHTSELGLDPANADNSTDTTPGTIQWTVADSWDHAIADEVVTLSGTVTVPDMHRHMKVSMYAGASRLKDGTGYTAAIDELLVSQSSTGLTIVASDGNTYGVSDEGDATVHDLVAAGQFDLDSTRHTIDGQLLQDRFAAIEAARLSGPRGLVKRGWRSMGGTSYATGVEAQVLTIAHTIEANRSMAVDYWFQVDSTVASNWFTVNVRYEYSATGIPAEPTTASAMFHPQDMGGQHTTSANAGEDLTFYLKIHNPSLPAGNYKFALFVLPRDGALVFRGTSQAMHIFDEGPAANVVPNSAYYSGTVAEPPPVVVDTTPFTLEATASKWWTGGNTYKGGGDSQYFGNTSSTGEGNRKSASWFNKTTMINKLGGKPPAKVEAYLYLFDGGNGNTVAFGKHDSVDSGSNSYPPAGANRQMDTSTNWNEGSGRWVTLNDTMRLAGWEKSGGAAGLLIGPATSDADSWSAAYRGASASSSLRPKLRFTPAP